MGEEEAREAIELARRHGLEEDGGVAVAYIVLGAAADWRGRLDEAEHWFELERASLLEMASRHLRCCCTSLARRWSERVAGPCKR